MNYFNLVSTYPDPTIAAAWESQIKEADKTAWLADTLKHCGNELFGRFATCYAELRALPRSARRALQRRIARSNELAAVLPQHLQQGGRQLQHRMAWSLAGAALLLALGQGVATAATITVTTNDPSIISDGQCSLIEAIVNANNDAATHADCAAGSGADTIVLPSNANVMLSAVYANVLRRRRGLPSLPVRSLLKVTAPRLLAKETHPPSVSWTWELRGPDASECDSERRIFLEVAAACLTWHTQHQRTAPSRVIRPISAAALFNFTAPHHRKQHNLRQYGQFRVAAYLTMSAPSQSKTAPSQVIRPMMAAAYLTSPVHSRSHRTAPSQAISPMTAVAYLTPGQLRLFGHPGTLTLNSSLIAGNQATVAPEIENRSIVTANNFNLFGTNGNAGVTGFTPGPTDIVPAPGVQVADILGPLENNGGPTQTHALVAGSPAIDAGNPSGCRENAGALLITDQRGFVRNFDGNHDGSLRCDIGSVEYGAEALGPPLVLAASRLLDAEIGVPYTSPSLITGGVQPYSIDVIAGALPPGLIYDPVNNTIFGTPSSFGLKSFRLRITDQAGTSKTATFSVRILRAVGITTKTIPAAFNGRSYRARLVALGGKAPFSWSLLSGNMPQGLSLSGSTGVISGIPTVSGTFDLSFQVTDPMGGIANTTLILNIK